MQTVYFHATLLWRCTMRRCAFCGKSVDGAHHNRKFCCASCQGKARYARTGQRITPQERSAWYRKRCREPGYRQKLRQQGRQRHKRVQQFLREYKVQHGCSICGYAEHHAALEFDHIRGTKELNVCFARSISRAKAEIKKCQVLCSNCHKIETYKRAQK